MIIQIIVLFVIIYFIAIIVLIGVVFLMLLLCLLELCFKVRVDLGHIWVDKRAAISKKVDDLGDQFRQALLTSRRTILLMLFCMVLRLDRVNWSWKMMSDCILVLGCFAH